MDISINEAFQYEPLYDCATSFRLLRLLPIQSSMIKCELEQRSTLDCEPYEALSYSWGSDEKVEQVLVNGESLWVTDNLHTALRYLALPDRHRVLWIDGICIDQNNSSEKSQQVQSMKAIYSRAEHVIFWLGKATPEVRILMRCLRALQTSLASGSQAQALDYARAHWPKILDSHDLRQQATAGLRSLLRRPWFRRVWILQEVANARSGSVCAGSMSVSASVFTFAISLLKPDQYEVIAYWQPVVDIMPGQMREESWWSQKPDLYTLLLKFIGSRASDTRDMVYALLGLSGDERDRQAVPIDYAKPLHEVFGTALRHFLRGEKSRIDHVLNIAAEVPGVATVVVVVQEETETDVKLFDCQQRTLKADSESPWWLRSQTVDDAKFVATQDSPVVAVCKHSTYIFTQQSQPNPQDVYTATLYSEVLSLFEDRVYDHDVLTGRPDIAHWGGQEGHVKLLVLEKALACRVLEFAAAQGFSNLLQLVLELDLVEREDALTCNAVYEAARGNRRAMVGNVLDMGFDLELCGEHGTPLQTAAGNGDVGVMEILIERGANIDGITDYGLTALSAAISNDQATALDFLIRMGANCKSDGWALIEACQRNREWALQRLLLSGTDPDFALYINMLADQHIPALVIALEHGANPNLLATSLVNHNFGLDFDQHIGQSMLHVATTLKPGRGIMDVMNVMRTLLEWGADINLVGEYESNKIALHNAFYEKYINLLDFLVLDGAYVNPDAHKRLLQLQTKPGRTYFTSAQQLLLRLLHAHASAWDDDVSTMKHKRNPRPLWKNEPFSDVDVLATRDLILWAGKQRSRDVNDATRGAWTSLVTLSLPVLCIGSPHHMHSLALLRQESE